MGQPRIRYSIRQILAWADQHKALTGRWPISRSGQILGTPHTWEAVNTALRKGICGLPGGDSLSKLLQRKRGVGDKRIRMPDLTLKQILEWADAHHSRTGRWPGRESGPVAEAPKITWATINRYLRVGGAKLKGGRSLVKVLREHRGMYDSRGHRLLTVPLVLKWAKLHHDRTGRWPVTLSGPLLNKPDENWAAIDVAMRNGRRGFPMRMSLSQLLRREFGEAYTKNIMQKKSRTGPRVRAIRVTQTNNHPGHVDGQAGASRRSRAPASTAGRRGAAP